MASASIFSANPDRADKALVRAAVKSLEGGDVGTALDLLGEAPARIDERPLASEVLSNLAGRLANEQVDNPSDHAKGLLVIIGSNKNLAQRLEADLKQRLPRRLLLWQTGPGAARALAADMHEAALADMAASALDQNPEKLVKVIGKKRHEALLKELRSRGFLASRGKLEDNLERCDWIAIIDDINDASDKELLAESLYQGLRRYFELPERGQIVSKSYLSDYDPEWEANPSSTSSTSSAEDDDGDEQQT